jgi:hypothetical protein
MRVKCGKEIGHKRIYKLQMQCSFSVNSYKHGCGEDLFEIIFNTFNVDRICT